MIKVSISNFDRPLLIYFTTAPLFKLVRPLLDHLAKNTTLQIIIVNKTITKVT